MKKNILKRKKDSHKGSCGRLLIVAASAGMSGSACLASESALRSGCGLVTLGVPKSLSAIVSVKLTEVIVKALPQTQAQTLSYKSLGAILKLLKNKNALAIGPGLSVNPDTIKLVYHLLNITEIPVVIDADAINCLSTRLSVLSRIKSNLIITPHPGEMARILGCSVEKIQKTRKKVAFDFAKKYNITVVLKGHETIIASAKQTYVNKTGNPGMATAGAGDVLTGIIGSFLAQGLNCFDAAKLGVCIHGLAGDLAAKETGEISLIASDIIKKLPAAFKLL